MNSNIYKYTYVYKNKYNMNNKYTIFKRKQTNIYLSFNM